ncbi:MAG TPA: HD-GYP domain-containing protein [Solirubrobacteraceae bacterium]|nr:HD-GYP domain-containing protein [Solirubrobacteraceae bacterium]
MEAIREACDRELGELIALIDRCEPGLASHSGLVGGYAAATAEELGMAPNQVARVELAGMVHDIGKVAMPEAILTKPGPLSPDEWARVRAHPEQGAWLLADAGLQDVAVWVLAHHERVDGRGYPHGIAGDEIPREAQILAVVDAYEAMTAARPYSSAMSHEQACDELERCAGTQFDPEVVQAFLRQARRRVAPVAV